MPEAVTSALPSAEEQRTALRDKHSDTISLEEGKIYHLVTTQWWKHWVAYAGWDHNDPVQGGITVPGPIDNALLLTDGAGEDLKDGVREGVEFTVVGEAAWAALVGWYGGGPAIARPTVVEGGAGGRASEVQLELTLLKLAVSLETDNPTLKSNSLGLPLTLRISRGASVAVALERICAHWSLDASKCRVWDYHGRKRLELLDMADSLSDSKMLVEQDLLVEMELEGGGWRYTDDTPASSMDVLDGTGGSASTAGGSSSTATGSGWGAARRADGEDTVVDGATPSSAGVVGLTNLGNTCFMNSMLQCLSNVAPLRGFFVSGDFETDLNPDNPLGAEGLLAQAFASLLRLMWGNGASVVSPRNFKHVLGRFAPQFAGYGQQDSQELCNYVLDKLHEDVNRVKKKPYVENYEAKDDEPDEHVVAEISRRHRQRNDSRIADLFQGFFKSTVVCPSCRRVSVTFDPFMSIAVPLSVADARKLAVTLRTFDGELTQVRVTVPLNGSVKNLLGAVVDAPDCPPLNSDSLVCVEVYNAKLQAIYAPGTRLEKLQNNDFIFVCETQPPTAVVTAVVADAAVAAAVPAVEATTVGAAVDANAVAADAAEPPLLVVVVQRAPPSGFGASNKFMGLPLTLTMPRTVSGAELTALVASRLRRYQKDATAKPPPEEAPPADDASGAPAPSASGGGALLGSALHGGGCIDDDGSASPKSCNGSPAVASPKGGAAAPIRSAQWKLFHSTMTAGSFGYEALGAPVELTDEACQFATPARSGSSSYSYGSSYGSSSTSSNNAEVAKRETRHLVLEWQSVAFSGRGAYERPKVEGDEADKAGIGCGKPPVGERTPAGGGGVELAACLNLFSKEETLDAENAWYCDRCKAHREATKKLQIWSLPSVLVVHLKRFSAQGMWRRKNDMPVDFPFEIDLAPYCLESQAGEGTGPALYDLIAVSNHYGSTGGGHYTAFAKHSESGEWHKFDDSHTAVVEPKDVVTPAAYVLMYGRRKARATGSPEV